MRWTEEQYRQYLDGGGGLVKAKPSKYRNQRTAGFDSKKELSRYQELELLEKAGEIRNLRRQVKYALVVNGIHVADYVADHVYEEGARTTVEDTKSIATRKLPVYQIKRKLMQACHGIEIRET